MSKGKPTPMTREAASRIATAVAKQNGGKIPPNNFAGRADAAVQRAQTNPVPVKMSKT